MQSTLSPPFRFFVVFFRPASAAEAAHYARPDVSFFSVFRDEAASGGTAAPSNLCNYVFVAARTAGEEDGWIDGPERKVGKSFRDLTTSEEFRGC